TVQTEQPMSLCQRWREQPSDGPGGTTQADESRRSPLPVATQTWRLWRLRGQHDTTRSGLHACVRGPPPRKRGHHDSPAYWVALGHASPGHDASGSVSRSAAPCRAGGGNGTIEHLTTFLLTGGPKPPRRQTSRSVPICYWHAL